MAQVHPGQFTAAMVRVGVESLGAALRAGEVKGILRAPNKERIALTFLELHVEVHRLSMEIQL